MNSNLSEAEQVTALFNGLRPEIKTCLKGHSHGTLRKLLKKAIAIEADNE